MCFELEALRLPKRWLPFRDLKQFVTSLYCTSVCPCPLLRRFSMQYSMSWQKKDENSAPSRLNLFNCPQCSRASVTLADKLPSISGAAVPTVPKSRDASLSLSFSPPRGGGDKGSGTVSIEGAAEGFFSEGDSERVAEQRVTEGVAEDIPQDAEQGKDDNGADITWNRAKLELGDVHVEKVVEKDALGSMAKGAMAVSCREVRQRGCSKYLSLACTLRTQVRHGRNSLVCDERN